MEGMGDFPIDGDGFAPDLEPVGEEITQNGDYDLRMANAEHLLLFGTLAEQAPEQKQKTGVKQKRKSRAKRKVMPRKQAGTPGQVKFGVVLLWVVIALPLIAVIQASPLLGISWGLVMVWGTYRGVQSG